MGKIKPHLIEIGIFLIVISLLSMGTYARNRLWNDEIALWSDCVKKSPNKARPYINLGLAYFNAGAYDKSQQMAQKAIEIDAKSAYAYYTLSLAYQKMGNLKGAIAMAKKSLDADPDLNIVYYSLGTIYFENGQYAEAEEVFNKFIKVFPFFPEVHHLLAIVYAAQKKFDQAIAEFERELRINPRHTLSHLNLGQIYWYEFQNREKAIYHLKAALTLDPLLPNRKAIQRLVRTLEGFPS